MKGKMSVISSMVLSALALASFSASAASVDVKWDDVKSFTDVEAVNSRQDRFEESIMTGLTEHLRALGEKLPADNQLQVTFHDVDIAGRVEPTFGALASSHQRILDDLSYPELVISYTYSDAEGQQLSSGEMVTLKKLAPMSTRRSALAAGRDNLYFEKELLNRWFKETLNN